MVGQRVGVPGTLPPIVGEIVIAFRRLKRDTFAFGRHRVGDRLRICSGVATVEGTLIDRTESRAIRVRLDRPLCLGIGEQVSVLRRHEEAGRELFEGIGSVLEVEEWPDIEPAEGAALAVAPARTVEWIPAERPTFSVATVATYTDLLRETMIRREELTEGSRLRLIEPRVDRVGRQTAWLNWAATHEALSVGAPEGTLSYQTHFRDFVERELLTSGSENAEEQLLLRGTWRVDDLRSLLTRYIETYKLCLQCRGTQTGLIHADGVLKVRCDRCRCENVTEM
jgi:translation initiation factor 2 beta subunit (eIF-2beta)/eIF-5